MAMKTNNYWFYYVPSLTFINHYTETEDEREFINTYAYFKIYLSIYSARKTRIPAIILSIIIFGVGFSILTHSRR